MPFDHLGWMCGNPIFHIRKIRNSAQMAEPMAQWNNTSTRHSKPIVYKTFPKLYFGPSIVGVDLIEFYVMGILQELGSKKYPNSLLKNEKYAC